MKILAIETSCDDTGVAIIEIKGQKTPCFNILSNIVSSQVEIHKKWGGVFPSLAKREHQKNLTPTMEKTLEKAGLLRNSKSPAFAKASADRQIPNPKQIQNSKFQKLNEILAKEKILCEKIIKFLKRYKKPDIGLIAVTVGPGLEPCLWQGVNFAKALSYFWSLPIAPVNHIEAHILANWLPPICENRRLPIADCQTIFPAISLVASGGHTQIILMKNFGKYEILGETRDDAAGECFDKTAKILGIGYPGGPAIAKLANKICPRSDLGKSVRGQTSVNLPRPMINTKDYDFSFSGLKTAVLYNFKSQPDSIKKDNSYLIEISREIQQAIIDVLIKKTIKAAKDYNVKTIILGGGVSANEELRKQFQQKIKKENLRFKFQIPSLELCADNGAMVGIAGYYGWLKKKIAPWQKIKADANLRIG